MSRNFHLPDVAFVIVLLVSFSLFFYILYPFLLPLIFSIFVVTLVWPLYQRLTRPLSKTPRIAALLGAVVTLAAVIVPSVFVGITLVEELIQLFRSVSTFLEGRSLQEALGSLSPIIEPLERYGVTEALRDLASEIASLLSGGLAPAIAAVGNLVIGAFIVVIGLYYMFLDGPALLDELVVVTPMEESYVREIAKSLASVVRSLFLASFFTAIVQGFLGVAAFTIVDLPNAVAWAALMAFFSLIFTLVPILGTGLVWVPVGIWLLLQGRLAAGIFILVYGAVILGLVDVVVRPVVAKATVELHPLIVLITLFGGLAVLGSMGALLGPLTGALVAAFAKVWVREVKPQLEAS